MKKIKNLAVGADIESIGRFGKLSRAGDRLFLNRIFTKNELDHCFSTKKYASCLAARYAGKEAIIKALSGLGKANTDYKMLEILNNKNGAPIAAINSPGYRNIHIRLSLSHCKDKAIAFAVAIES